MRRWGIIMIVLAVLAVIVATIIGTTGLVQNPVKSTSTSGTTTITGTFEPYDCGTGCVRGYVGAGARNVFVIFPNSCPEPTRGSTITVQGVLDPSQGSAAYRVAKCA